MITILPRCIIVRVTDWRWLMWCGIYDRPVWRVGEPLRGDLHVFEIGEAGGVQILMAGDRLVAKRELDVHNFIVIVPL